MDGVSTKSSSERDSLSVIVVGHFRSKFVTPPESRYSISNLLVSDASITIV